MLQLLTSWPVLWRFLRVLFGGPCHRLSARLLKLQLHVRSPGLGEGHHPLQQSKQPVGLETSQGSGPVPAMAAQASEALQCVGATRRQGSRVNRSFRDASHSKLRRGGTGRSSRRQNPRRSSS